VLEDATTNVVVATGTDRGGNEVSAEDTVTVETYLPFVEEPDPEISVVKTVDRPEAVEPGGVFNYTVVVTNTGSSTVTLTSVVDDKFGTVYEGEGIVLRPGESRQFNFQMTHKAEGEYKNTVVATAVDAHGGEATASDSARVVVRKSGISVVKSSDAPEGGVLAGSEVTYTYVVTNTGQVTLYDIVATDDKLGVVGEAATLAPGESVTFTVTTVLDETTTNVVVVTGKDKDGNQVRGEDTVTVETYLPYHENDPKPKKQNPPFLPYTGGTIAALIAASTVSMLIGGYLYKKSKED